MAITARTNLRGRLGVLIAGSLVFTALTAGAAAASVPAPARRLSPARLFERVRSMVAPSAVCQARPTLALERALDDVQVGHDVA